MNRAQKIIVILSLVLILVAFLFPPYLVMRNTTLGKVPWGSNRVVDSGWGCLFGFKTMRTQTNYGYYDEYQTIRPDVLALEILAVVTLGGIGLFIFKKPRKLGDKK